MTDSGANKTRSFNTIKVKNLDIGKMAISAPSANATTIAIPGAAAGGDLSLTNTFGSINLNAGEASTDAINISASNAAGGVAITSGTGGVGVLSTGTTTIQSTLGVEVRSSQAAADAVWIDASGVNSGITIDSGLGGMAVTSTGPVIFNIADDIVIGALGMTTITGATFEAGAISGVTPLSRADSGTLYTVDGSTGVYAITIPSPSAGVNFRFALIANGNDVTITSTGANIIGTITEGTPGVTAVTGHTNIIFGAGAAVGSTIELYSTATRYIVRAFTATGTGITVS